MHPYMARNPDYGLKQCLAEAEVPAGARTELHVHRKTEELYHIS